MKKAKWLCLLAGLTFGLAACGGGQSSGTSNNAAGSSAKSNPRAIFEKHCSSCHGNNLQGKVGPNLQHIGKDMTKKQILHQIKNGGGGMPANVINGKKAQKVAAWLAKKK